MKPLYDTNILIDFLAGDPRAQAEIARYTDHAISVITWMEVMIGTTAQNEAATRAFLGGFTVVDVDSAVREQAVKLRQAHRMKLPDAIIWASAQVHGLTLVTRNTKDFPASAPGVRVPYTV
ncbi:PilT protein domain protein (plasmid) [Methylobacterium nodulans ORS 2060]|uniref:Ribonuclease VapC n=1 Tax=Methylobacterium nodulans (strain LMG 21967 / CNCM I-2342 / ORS 2060) TaxID=460265 RepID=B8IY14_METNO|nr:PilT protein domain protein [Methylobacterium nodulans ORS 2060]